MKIVGPIPEHIKRLMPDYQAPKPIEDHVESEEEQKSEKELQNQIANYLRQRGIPFYQARMDKKTVGTIGWPDFTFPFEEDFYGVEVKVGSNRTTPEQARCIVAIVGHGGIAVVVRSFEQFVNLLK